MEQERIEQLRAKISACPGWTLRRELAGLARSYKVFLGNDAELRDYLRRHSELPMALELWRVENREGFERFLDEIDRLLHNYVAAAGTLRDHTLRVWKKHAPADEAVLAEYERRKLSTFADSGVAQFVLRLRNYTLHRRLPIARGRLSWTEDQDLNSMIFLERDELLRWDEWSPPARRYLQDASDDVNLAEVVDEYSSAVVEFNTWFGEEYVRGHLRAFDELRSLEQEFAKAYAEAAESD
jgi:hypothetical protein